jgi:hypothetical protein
MIDILKMLAALREEREQIEDAIITLERLARGRSKRRGRPPVWMQAIKQRGRPPASKNKAKESAAAKGALTLYFRRCELDESNSLPTISAPS